MPFNMFISIDEEAKSLDTTSSRKERQSRRKRYLVFCFSFCGQQSTAFVNEEQTLLCTEGFRVAMDFGPHLETVAHWRTGVLPELQQAARRQPSRCEIQASPLHRIPWCGETARLHAGDGCQAVVVANRGGLGAGLLLEAAVLVSQDSVQRSVSSQEQVPGAHSSSRDYGQLPVRGAGA